MTTDATWQEQNSVDFVDFAKYFVPHREVQLQVVTAVIPPPRESVTMIDLCCGEGVLSEALLTAFPDATVIGLDLSATMLAAANRRLATHGERFQARAFDIAEREWRLEQPPAHAIVSSLAVHHLDGPGKRSLFADVYRMLAPGGVFVLADIVQPASAAGLALASDMWNDLVRDRRADAADNIDPYERFHALKWNSYQYPNAQDTPSSLNDQLLWLREAGFTDVDVYWMTAGHAIFGGTRTRN
nr:class I SAM-dependent methyltransferase [Kibdelosporangium sp. MJ126-NF4]CEL20723.1 Methyltransferase [Kibdelosporangium sp. MJ126-NF4]CTQ89636.1 Methyltransferase [Kibdelosporangium sp. MJ126-NF4]